MKKINKALLITAFTIFSANTLAEVIGEVSVFKVIKEGEREVLVEATTAENGDILEYQIKYSNETDQDLKSFGVVGNIQNTTTFIKGSNENFKIDGDNVSAGESSPVFSIDNGASFIERPMKSVTVNGEVNNVDAEVTEYNKIKWNVETFDSNQVRTFNYRVLVNE